MGNTTIDLVDEVQKQMGLNDYKLAKRLDIGPQAISHYRKGRTKISDENAVKLCAMIGRAPAPVLVALAVERAKVPEVEKVWREVQKAVGRGKGGKVA